MTDPDIINELRTIRTWADMVSERAAKAIKRLERVNAPAARKGALSAEQLAKLIAKRSRTLHKNQK